MSTNCAPLVADLLCFERDFMLSISDNNQADIFEAFKFKLDLRYLDDLLNIDNPYLEQRVCHIYPTELKLNKANSLDTEVLFFEFGHVHNKWHSLI